MKYLGEIERGEANPSLDVIQRIATALEWNPFEVPLREQEMQPEGVQTLLLSELTLMQHRVQTAIGWVQTLDAARVRRTTEPPPELPHASALAGRASRSARPRNPGDF